jgi:hypothetical protein
MFTISRYGEIISVIDGFVLQSLGSGQTPQFVDPDGVEIGFDSTTFVYSEANAVYPPGYGTIMLRSGGLGLIDYCTTPDVPWMWTLSLPASGNQVWSMQGIPNSVFSQYQEFARQFFSDPAPLPGEVATIAAIDSATIELASQLDKTTKVIITLLTGVLDIAAGISVGSLADQAVTKVAVTVLGNADVAAKIAVIMQGTVTAASIIAVADGITKAGLWLQLFKMMLPNSFWGWTLTIVKLGFTIVSWAIGVGLAVTGAKIALLVASILLIIKEGAAEAEAEAEALLTHVALLRSVHC